MNIPEQDIDTPDKNSLTLTFGGNSDIRNARNEYSTPVKSPNFEKQSPLISNDANEVTVHSMKNRIQFFGKIDEEDETVSLNKEEIKSTRNSN